MSRPKLVLIGGSLATGKTTMSRTLSTTLGYPRVSLDEIKETLFDVAGSRDRAWSKQIGRLAFPVFQGLIELHLGREESVIADATFLWVDDARWIREFIERYQADVYLVWLTADPRVLRDRFLDRARTTRHPGHCDAVEAVVQEFDERFFNKTFLPLPVPGRTKVIDTTDPSLIQHEEIVSFISTI